MFLEITKQQLNYFEEELIGMISKSNTIIEFCSTPLICTGVEISQETKDELESIINKLKNVTEKLEQAKIIIKE